MKRFNLKTAILALSLILCGLFNTANAHLIGIGWNDNGDGTVDIFGEHWHGDSTVASMGDVGLIFTNINTAQVVNMDFTAVLNNATRATLLGNGSLDGYFDIGNNNDANHDWFIAQAVSLTDGTWNITTKNSSVLTAFSSGSSIRATFDGLSVATVSEPTTLAILSISMFGLLLRRKSN